MIVVMTVVMIVAIHVPIATIEAATAAATTITTTTTTTTIAAAATVHQLPR